MTALRTNQPELEDAVITALERELLKDELTQNLVRKGFDVKDAIRMSGLGERFRDYIKIATRSDKFVLFGYGYNIEDSIKKRRYDAAIKRAKENKSGPEYFVGEGITDNCGWYITREE